MRSSTALMIALLLAGCTGTQSPRPTASEPTADAQWGTVEGIVVDGELRAAPDVGIAALAANRTTVTDADGRFQLTGLPSGPTDVALTKTGYGSRSLRVMVVAGDVVRVPDVVLVRLPVPKEPSVETFLGAGFIACGLKFGGSTPTQLRICETAPNNQQLFDFTVERQRGLVAIVLELVWTPSAPGTATHLREELWKTNCPQCETVRYPYGTQGDGQLSGPSPIKMVFGNSTAPFVDGLEPEGKTRLEVFASVSRDTNPPAVVAIAQKVDFHVSVFYNSAPTASYSDVAP